MQNRKTSSISKTELNEQPLNDYSRAPEPFTVNEDLNRTWGSSTGNEENATEPGGWAGTDDATSTAPSDMPTNTRPLREQDSVDERLERVSDLSGNLVEESRDWKNEPLDPLY